MDHTDAANLARFLTLADTAEVLAISARQAYGLVRSGELRAIKVGNSAQQSGQNRGQWRVERSELEAYIEAKYEESRRLGLWNQSDYANVYALASSEDRASSNTPAHLNLNEQ